MMRAAAQGRIGYFGKIPSRSDFVKLAHDTALTSLLDDWLAQVMSALPYDARWKINYDALAPLDFAFVGPRRRQPIAGHIVASRDRSGRRFPFMLMRTLEVADPAAFVSHCPLVLAPLWSRLASMAQEVVAASDPGARLLAIPDTAIALGERGQDALEAFLANGTITSLCALLGQADARQVILALGLLLAPVMHSSAADLEKSLVLPLPDDPAARCPVAAFWLELIAPFLRRADFDLALFVTRLEHKPVLVVGFCSAAVQALHAIIDPLVGREQQIGFSDTAWVGEQLGVDVDVRALASYLDQPQLPLTMARALFLQTFIGAAP